VRCRHLVSRVTGRLPHRPGGGGVTACCTASGPYLPVEVGSHADSVGGVACGMVVGAVRERPGHCRQSRSPSIARAQGTVAQALTASPASTVYLTPSPGRSRTAPTPDASAGFLRLPRTMAMASRSPCGGRSPLRPGAVGCPFSRRGGLPRPPAIPLPDTRHCLQHPTASLLLASVSVRSRLPCTPTDSLVSITLLTITESLTSMTILVVMVMKTMPFTSPLTAMMPMERRR
jgi:hypothetical protein